MFKTLTLLTSLACGQVVGQESSPPGMARANFGPFTVVEATSSAVPIAAAPPYQLATPVQVAQAPAQSPAPQPFTPAQQLTMPLRYTAALQQEKKDEEKK